MTDQTRENLELLADALTLPSEGVYCASPRAIEAAAEAYPGNDAGRLADALIAAHDPTLGLDRSVCLRDVVEYLRVYRPTSAGYVAREFGGAA